MPKHSIKHTSGSVNKKTSQNTSKDDSVSVDKDATSIQDEAPTGVGGRYQEIGAGRRVRVSD